MAIPLLFCCVFLESVLASVDFQEAAPHLLECRMCRNAIHLEDCRETQLCTHNEECFMESILTPQLQVIFNGGCRSTMVCSAVAHHTGKRAVTDYVICSACCNSTKLSNTTECNANLCGIRTKNDHSNQCYYCGDDFDVRQGGVTNPLSCQKIKYCADDEVCRTTTKNVLGIITYEFGCQQLLQCQLLTIIGLQKEGVNTGVDVQHLAETGEIILGRKRQIDVCDICCGDGLCNDDKCEAVRTRLAVFARHGRFNYTTLSLIR